MAEYPITQKALPTAFCLGGGGAKGAFQIGAWKALEEAGMLSEIRAVAGCSVGALNAVLFAIGDLALAEQLWGEIVPADLLSLGLNGAFFSRDGLTRMINRLSLEKVRNSPLRIHVAVRETGSDQAVFFELNGLPDDAIRTLLLASSAIPHIYPPERYLGTEFQDAGALPQGDLCISPVYQQGHRELLLLSLHPELSVYGSKRYGKIDLRAQYPDAQFTIIKPLRPMGNLVTGTLNFTQDKIKERIRQGYEDTKTALSGICKQAETAEQINAILTQKAEKLFPNGERLADFIQGFGNRFAPNIALPTLGGDVWYDNIFAVDGWRIQQQHVTGLQSHYRILTPENVRAAWVLDPKKLIAAMDDYEKSLLG